MDDSDARTVDFSKVYVASPGDSGSLLSSKIASGLDIVLTGGLYNLTEPIVIGRSNAVVLGIGFPTLVSAGGLPTVRVTASEGVRLAGILYQAGPKNTSALLDWGTGDKGNPSNPGFIYDCFARVGGTTNPAVQQLTADTVVVIRQGYVVIDNAWIWRADHGSEYSHNKL